MKTLKFSTGQVIAEIDDDEATLVERVDEPGIADLVTTANVEIKGINLSLIDSPDVWVQ